MIIREKDVGKYQQFPTVLNEREKSEEKIQSSEGDSLTKIQEDLNEEYLKDKLEELAQDRKLIIMVKKLMMLMKLVKTKARRKKMKKLRRRRLKNLEKTKTKRRKIKKLK